MREHDKQIDNYTTIYNQVLRDRNISNEARGLFCYMLSNDKNTWKFSEVSLVSETGSTITKIKNSIKELMEFHYVIRKRERINGKLQGCIYILQEKPPNYIPDLKYPPKKDCFWYYCWYSILKLLIILLG